MDNNLKCDNFIMLPKNDLAFKFLFGDERSKDFQRAYQQLEVLSMDEAIRAQYEAREAWLRDEATRQYKAENRGWQKGLQEGEAKGRIEGDITRNISNAIALLDVLDDATIAEKLALPIEAVQRLRAGDRESVKAELLAASSSLSV